jgi:hypothetical protein
MSNSSLRHIVVEGVDLPGPLHCVPCGGPIPFSAVHDLVICRDTSAREPLCRSCAEREAPRLADSIFSIRPILLEQLQHARDVASRAADIMRRMRRGGSGASVS